MPVGLAVRICDFHPQGPGSTPGLRNFVRIEHIRNHVTFGRNKVLKTVCTNHIQTRGAGNSYQQHPSWSSGKDLWLSPTRPWFGSRTGKLCSDLAF